MITQKIANIVKGASKKESNFFGPSAWLHILTVKKYASKLAKKLNADQETVEIAALLHDYASILDYKLYPKHHIYSTNLAEQILIKYNFPKDKINAIKHCIKSHRGSQNIKRKTIEAKILASADALSHFDSIPNLFYLSYVKHKMNIENGKKWVLLKLQRDWNKLLPEAQKIIKPKYNLIKELLK